MKCCFIFFLLVVGNVLRVCDGHARLLDPPPRAIERRDFRTRYNHNNKLDCGVFNIKHKARCGLCGGSFTAPSRTDKAAWKFANGEIVRNYTEGSIIPVTVELTSDHKGFIEFRICAVDKTSLKNLEKCLNSHLVTLGNKKTDRNVESLTRGQHVISLQLPDHLVCQKCIFQFRYVAGNNRNCKEGGSGPLGCGPQEEFKVCSDIAIIRSTKRFSFEKGIKIAGPKIDKKTTVPSFSLPFSSVSFTQSHSVNKLTKPNAYMNGSSTNKNFPINNSTIPITESTKLSNVPTIDATIIPTTTAPSIPGEASTLASSTPLTVASINIVKTSAIVKETISSTMAAVDFRTSNTESTKAVTGIRKACFSYGIWKNILSNWCDLNCNNVPPFCPKTICKCQN